MEQIQIEIIDGPLPAASAGSNRPSASQRGSGAVLCFEGWVRPLEDNRPLQGLDYEAYEPMASKTVERICTELIEQHALDSMHFEHSTGHVPVGACSFRLTIYSAHRKEGLAAMDAFIDRLKVDVPIWKQPVWKDDT